MLVRSLKGLESCISMSHTGINFVYDSATGEYRGWPLPEDPTGNGFATTYDVYHSNQPNYGTKQLSVPILFDTKEKVIVSNDNAQLCIMLNAAFNPWARNPSLDLYPEDLQKAIEAINAVTNPGLCDGVYRCRFAGTDEAYQEAFASLHAALDFVEKRLSAASYLAGETLSLADVRALPHLLRFDVIYHSLMLREPRGPLLRERCPITAAYLARLFCRPEVFATCDLQAATRGYFNQMGPATPLAECDALYMRGRSEWMPDLTALDAKRLSEGLPATAVLRMDARGSAI
mmetsp:Transcript_123719/g.263772  ORF Transcript_123719/g.263772 Transcript_123719/m.263772 type:complete len:289 (+) Transcript_123719:2-868(+)